MRVKKGPWTVTDSKTIYKNPWIKVTEDKVIRPDGNIGIFSTVRMKDGVSVLPLDNDNNVCLSKEFHYGTDKVGIEVATGGIEENEDIKKAASRELKEETGIVAGTLIDLGVIDPFTTVVASKNYLFLAKDLEFKEAQREGTEEIEVFKVPFDKALEWVNDGTITHSASVVLILKAKEYLRLT